MNTSASRPVAPHISDRPLHGVIVLAAGVSARLGQPKQLLLHRGETLVRRAVRLAIATQPADAVIVLGAQADRIDRQIRDLPIRRVDCADWQVGMGASLRCGVAALSAQCSGVLIVLCDQPALETEHLDALCAIWREHPDDGAASMYAGRRGVPALLPREWLADLGAQSGDRGARDLLVARPDRIHTVVNETLVHDVDFPADLALLS